MQARDFASAEEFFDQTISLSPDELTGLVWKSRNLVMWRGDMAMARTVAASIRIRNRMPTAGSGISSICLHETIPRRSPN